MRPAAPSWRSPHFVSAYWRARLARRGKQAPRDRRTGRPEQLRPVAAGPRCGPGPRQERPAARRRGSAAAVRRPSEAGQRTRQVEAVRRRQPGAAGQRQAAYPRLWAGHHCGPKSAGRRSARPHWQPEAEPRLRCRGAPHRRCSGPEHHRWRGTGWSADRRWAPRQAPGRAGKLARSGVVPTCWSEAVGAV